MRRAERSLATLAMCPSAAVCEAEVVVLGAAVDAYPKHPNQLFQPYAISMPLGGVRQAKKASREGIIGLG